MSDSSRNEGVSGLNSEVLEFHKFSSAHLPVEAKYGVKMLITDLFKFDRKLRKRYNGCQWKTQMWS